MNSKVKFIAVSVASLIAIGSAFAASEAENRTACKKLYVGQAITDREYQLGMVIIGVGEQKASIRVVSAKNPKEIGTIEEFNCTTLLKDAGG